MSEYYNFLLNALMIDPSLHTWIKANGVYDI